MTAAKQIARLAARFLALPVVLAYQLGAALSSPERLFPGLSQAIALAPGQCGNYLRFAVYRAVLPRVGDDVLVGFGTIFSAPDVTLGRSVYIGAYGVIGSVSIEQDVLIGSRVSILNGNRQHGTDRLDVPIREQPGQWPRVTIGRDCWIGDGATVMADIGEQTVVGAAAVVTKPLPPRVIAVGNPARVVRQREEATTSAKDEGGDRISGIGDRGSDYERSF